MDQSGDQPKWRREYSIVLMMGIVYIFLLGLFTWLFNHSL